MKKFASEVIGTFALVFAGTGAIVIRVEFFIVFCSCVLSTRRGVAAQDYRRNRGCFRLGMFIFGVVFGSLVSCDATFATALCCRVGLNGQ